MTVNMVERSHDSYLMGLVHSG